MKVINIVAILLIGALLLSGCASKEISKPQESKTSTSDTNKNLVVNKIKQDNIYKSISEDFEPTISFLDSNKIEVKLNLVNPELQEFVGDEMEGMLTTLTEMYMAFVVDEHVDNYDSIKIVFFDINGKQFHRKIFVKEEIERAGITREDFDIAYNS